MGFVSRLTSMDSVFSYPFAGLALMRGTLWLWLQYERTRTEIVYLRRARAHTSEQPIIGS
jgi:hypothetical protein